MTAAGPDPYAETVRLLPADTFTYFRQTRDEWVEIVARAICYGAVGEEWHPAEEPEEWYPEAAVVVDALLAHLAAQQARPMPGGGGQ